MVFWDIMPSDPEVEKLVLIARAFSILKQETNQKTKKDVIRYRKNSELGEDIVTREHPDFASIQKYDKMRCFWEKPTLSFLQKYV
jgi:hypothetical protein